MHGTLARTSAMETFTDSALRRREYALKVVRHAGELGYSPEFVQRPYEAYDHAFLVDTGGKRARVWLEIPRDCAPNETSRIGIEQFLLDGSSIAVYHPVPSKVKVAGELLITALGTAGHGELGLNLAAQGQTTLGL